MASKEPPKPQGAPQEPKTQSLNDEEVLDFSELKPGEYSLHVPYNILFFSTFKSRLKFKAYNYHIR